MRTVTPPSSAGGVVPSIYGNAVVAEIINAWCSVAATRIEIGLSRSVLDMLVEERRNLRAKRNIIIGIALALMFAKGFELPAMSSLLGAILLGIAASRHNPAIVELQLEASLGLLEPPRTLGSVLTLKMLEDLRQQMGEYP